MGMLRATILATGVIAVLYVAATVPASDPRSPAVGFAANPQVITAPSGTPMIIYDRARLRVVLVDQHMPQGMEVCIHRICLLDTEWERLGQQLEASR